MFDFLHSIPPQLYNPIFIYSIVGLSFITSIYYINSKESTLVYSQKTELFLPACLVLMCIFFIGGRPNSMLFSDSYMYVYQYNVIGFDNDGFDFSSEWLWAELGNTCKKLGFSFNGFFTIIALIYFGGMLIACYLISKNNLWIAIIFCLCSFSCYGYASNGIRNGAACSLMLITIALFTYGKTQKIIALVLSIAALGIHRSSALPLSALMVSYYCVTNFKQAIYVWIASIIISLAAGDYVMNFFMNLGFDDRLEQYISTRGQFDYLYSHTGFRWDFVLYSVVPILFGYYLMIKRNFKDKVYLTLLSTYTISNSFWIMVIRATSSNRFAYLSWFIYPLVIAYPLLRMNIWEDQDRKTAWILLAYAGFTFFMFLIGK